MLSRIRSLLHPASGAPVLLSLCLLAGTVLAAVLIPGFASSQNLLGLIASLSPVVLLALGVSLVVLTGGIDLSVTAVVALVSISVGRVLTAPQVVDLPSGLQLLVAVAAAFGIGIFVGALNGVLVTRTGMPSFIVTLAMMMLGSGVAVWSTGSQVVGGLPQGPVVVGQSLAVSLGISAFAVLACELALRCTVAGRWVYAVGQNATASLISGVPVRRVVVGVFCASGVMAAVSALLLTARLETGSPVMGKELLLDAIGATVIGGTRLAGGVGRPLWTLVGVAFFGVLDNALNLLNVSYFAIMMIKGGVILVAAVAGASRGKDAQ